MENIGEGTPSTIEIGAGTTITGNENGIWHGSCSTSITITGGEFTGNGGTHAGLRIHNENDKGSGGTVTILGGTFTGKQDGIWYGNNSVKLNISGGTFTGKSRSGLFFEVAPGTVQLSGGTFVGNTPSKESGTGIAWREVYCYHNGAISCKGEITGIYLSQRYSGVEIGYNDIVASGKTVYYGNNQADAEDKSSSFSSGTVHEMFAQYAAICIA